MMKETLAQARSFLLSYGRLLERRLFQVHFEGAAPNCIASVIRAYQNPDGGLGHALEPDLRCPESQPIFAEIGLLALEEAGCRDHELAYTVCDYLESVADNNGLVPFLLSTAYKSPLASHMANATLASGLNPTVGICGLLHYQGVQHDWLSRATATCCKMITHNPPLEAHTLLGVSRLAEFLPDRVTAMNLLEIVASVLAQASFFIPNVPVQSYGLTPLHFAPKPDSICRGIFTERQIDEHLKDLEGRQLPDGGWPISWDAPGLASELEWRGRWTLEAICQLSAYGVI